MYNKFNGDSKTRFAVRERMVKRRAQERDCVDNVQQGLLVDMVDFVKNT